MKPHPETKPIEWVKLSVLSGKQMGWTFMSNRTGSSNSKMAKSSSRSKELNFGWLMIRLTFLSWTHSWSVHLFLFAFFLFLSGFDTLCSPTTTIKFEKYQALVQWAAVKSHLSPMTTAPHFLCFMRPNSLISISDACHGISPKILFSPPTILPTKFSSIGRWPHVCCLFLEIQDGIEDILDVMKVRKIRRQTWKDNMLIWLLHWSWVWSVEVWSKKSLFILCRSVKSLSLDAFSWFRDQFIPSSRTCR